MSEHVVRKLDFGRKLLLSAVASLAIAVPVIFGLVHATPSRAQSQDVGTAAEPQVSSVSIRPSAQPTDTMPGNKSRTVRMMFGPDGYRADGVTMRALIQEAYGLQANQILGGPEWLDSAAYDVEVSTKNANEKKLSANGETRVVMDMQHEKFQHLFQGILADRARLALHRETQDLPRYILNVGDGGSKLQTAQHDKVAEPIDNPGSGTVTVDRQVKIDGEGHMIKRRGMFIKNPDDGSARTIAAQGSSIEEIARQLSFLLGVNVVDDTGLHGNYDFTLEWQADSSNPESLIKAVQEQLGLKLQQQTAPTQVLVIDHIERPEEITSASR